MDESIRLRLAELNRAFYQDFATDFDRTRQSWLPSFQRILPHLAGAANVLDLGCGNGRFLRFLASSGWRGSYVGLDGNTQLLEAAREASSGLTEIETRFVQADLQQAGWDGALSNQSPHAAIVCLAVLHHIPGCARRSLLVSEVAELMPPGGRLVISTWQFMNSPRVRERVLPWRLAGMSEGDVEPGDYLVGWGHGAKGQRYCAMIGRAELTTAARDARLREIEVFEADGKSDDLNLYGVFERL